MCMRHSISSAVTAFKPRQVLLAEQQLQRRSSTQMAAKQLKPEDESVVVYSVALWLENKGFTKVLKRFIPAAQIQDENWKTKALNLNEVFSKYQEICNGAHEGDSLQKPKASKEPNDEKACEPTVDQSAKKQKDKKKKKSKLTSESLDNDGMQTDAVPEVCKLKHGDLSSKVTSDKDDSQVIDESKDKKKKKKLKRKNLVDDDKDAKHVESEANGVKVEKKKKKEDSTEKKLSKEGKVEAADDWIDESKKESKKRKRIDTDENETQTGEDVAGEQSKPKKNKSLEEGKDAQPQMTLAEANGHAGGQNKEETFQIGHNNGVDKSRQTKSSRKQRNGSVEPKTVNAFQRVKIEEVKFADEKLQDNSYWAKEGAETGYGAKAQEVLGQVKGRDFRHEKTKKKRGSYRGGLIDLNSHSIKFNYSDDE